MKKMRMLVWTAGLALGASLGPLAQARCAPHSGVPVADTSMLEVKPSSLDVSVDAGHRMVTTLGTITNPSSNCFQNVVLELQYFDPSKRHIDTVVEPVEGLVVPAGETVEFRVREPASKEASAYVTQSVRVVDADVRWVKSQEAGHGVFIDLLLSWAPMILLIGVWVYFMRKQSGQKSVQSKMLVLMEKQLQVAEVQSRAIQQAAAALERRPSGEASA
jgi:hypothetical protein